MKLHLIFTGFLVLLSAVCASYPYIFSVKLGLKEDNIQRLIAESVCGKEQTLKSYFDYSQITLIDVKEIVADLEVEFKKVLEILEIGLEDVYYLVSRDIVVQVLNQGNISAHSLYNTFLKYYINDPVEDIRKALNVLGIDNDKFGTAVVIGSDKDLVDILLRGNYNLDNVKQVLTIIKNDIQLSTALDFAIDINTEEILFHIKKDPLLVYTVEGFKNLVNVDSLTNLLNFLNLTAYDIYNNKPFKNTLKNAVNTKEVLVGTAVSPEEIVTLSDSIILLTYNILRDFSVLIAESVENPMLQQQLQDIVIPANPAVINIKFVHKVNVQEYPTFRLGVSIKTPHSCVYLTKSNRRKKVYSKEVVAHNDGNDNLWINKTASTIYNDGSPLICDSYLMGVANWEYPRKVEFLPTYNGPVVFEDEHHDNNTLSNNVVDNISHIVVQTVCDILKLLNIKGC